MGPLAGLKIVEFEAIGPTPMCAMMLADMGASIIRLVRETPVELGSRRLHPRFEITQRSRPAMRVDLKDPAVVEEVRQLIAGADGVVEGFRPGVMERLGLGPQVCHALNPRLVYGRLTGWGRDGPLSDAAGHDINYVAVTGVLNAIGRTGQLPSVPLALAGDFGAAAMFLAQGMLAGFLQAGRTGRGQVVDVAIADAAAALASRYYGTYASGELNHERGSNMTDSGSHFYDVYECADGKLVSVGAVESRFYRELLERMGIDAAMLGPQKDAATWPKAKQVLAERFRTRTRSQWCEILEGSDACFAPVLSFDEAPRHLQFAARRTFVALDGVWQPRNPVRFSATPCADPEPARQVEPFDAARARRFLAGER